MSNIKRLKDKDGNYIYPVTHASAVFDDDGKTIGDLQGEVVDARGESDCLKDRLDIFDSQLTHKVNKNDLAYINVEDYGMKAEEGFDNTDIFNYMISQGIKYIYFPKGTYYLNMVISTSNINIKGSGRSTILRPYNEYPVIKLFCNGNGIQNCSIKDLSLLNNDEFNCDGLLITANGMGVNGINDWHVIENVYIENFENGIKIEDRTIWSTFRNVISNNNNNNGIRIVSNGTAGACVNLNTFYNCRFGGNVNEGIYIDATTLSTGEYDYDDIPLNNNFISCNVENNGNKHSTSRPYGVYCTDIDLLNFDGCYIEGNGLDNEDGIAFYFNSKYIRGLNIRSTLAWGSKTVIKIPDKCQILNGNISGNRFIGVFEINPAYHVENRLVFDSNYNSPDIKKLDNTMLSTNIVTLSPFSSAIVHDNTSTPNVVNTNFIATFASKEITNFLNGLEGQFVVVRPYGDGVLTFKNGNHITLRDSNICTINPNESIIFIKFNNKWVEISRNTSSN